MSETNLPIKKAECYVVPPFTKEGDTKSFLIIELYINKEHPELGSISQNNVLSEVTKYIFSDERYNIMISHYFTTVVIARKADGSDSFKRLGGPYVYDNNKYVCPWKFLQRRGKSDYSKLYVFNGMEGYHYGKVISIYCVFPDKKNMIVSKVPGSMKYDAKDRRDFMKLFIGNPDYVTIWNTRKNEWLTKHS